jgi:hypothetical protein
MPAAERKPASLNQDVLYFESPGLSQMEKQHVGSVNGCGKRLTVVVAVVRASAPS